MSKVTHYMQSAIASIHVGFRAYASQLFPKLRPAALPTRLYQKLVWSSLIRYHEDGRTVRFMLNVTSRDWRGDQGAIRQDSATGGERYRIAVW